MKRMNNSRPPWGAGSGANRIAGRSGENRQPLRVLIATRFVSWPANGLSTPEAPYM